MSIESVLGEGRLIRNDWCGRDEEGRVLLCLYTALVDDPDARPNACPAKVAPKWLAMLLPWIDDAGTQEAWEAVVRRVAAIAPKFGKLQGERSERLRNRCLAVLLRDLLPIAGDATKVVAEAIGLCEHIARGGEVSLDTWGTLAAAAWSVIHASRTARGVVGIPWPDVWGYSVQEYAAFAVRAIAVPASNENPCDIYVRDSLCEVVLKVTASHTAHRVGAEAERRLVADRLTTLLLDEIERELKDD